MLEDSLKFLLEEMEIQDTKKPPTKEADIPKEVQEALDTLYSYFRSD